MWLSESDNMTRSGKSDWAIALGYAGLISTNADSRRCREMKVLTGICWTVTDGRLTVWWYRWRLTEKWRWIDLPICEKLSACSYRNAQCFQETGHDPLRQQIPRALFGLLLRLQSAVHFYSSIIAIFRCGKREYAWQTEEHIHGSQDGYDIWLFVTSTDSQHF